MKPDAMCAENDLQLRDLANARRFRVDDHGHPEQTDYLRACFRGSGWSQTAGDDWDFFWSIQMHDDAVFDRLTDKQLVNHFPGNITIVSKDTLFYYLSAAAKRANRVGASRLFQFFPRVYTMPQDYDAFVQAAATEHDGIWVQKPKRDWGGHGIELITDPSVVNRGDDWLVQDYVEKPLLLPGHPYKHVLRIYLLITSLDPLVVYMHSAGSVRFTSRPYTEARDSLSDIVVHFINGYLQKRDAGTPVWTEDFNTYRQRLNEAGIDDSALWLRIREMLILTVIAHREPLLAESLNRTERVQCCFDLFGFDVLIDEMLKPWLLECNMSPALAPDAPQGTPDRDAQRRSREPVISDMLGTLGLLGPERKCVTNDRGTEHFLLEGERCGGFERIFPGLDARRFSPLLQIPRQADLDLIEAVEAMTTQ